MRARRTTLIVAAGLIAALAACGGQTHQGSPPIGFVEASPSGSPSLSPSPQASPSPSVKPSPSRKPSPKPSKKVSTRTVPPVAEKPPVKPAAGDGVPTTGAGTFAVAGGSTGVVGTGTTLVKYRVEVEQGITWGTNPVWTVDEFAGTVDTILAGGQGWTMSAEHPVTDADEQMTDASWSFQRVADTSYSVRIRLATPDTVDKLCGSAGVDTEGVYSCRYGKNIMINLRRWLKGATGFTNMPFYRNMVINHEMGHFLGFNHMKCPGSGRLAPVMQTQTIALNGCLPNDKPFTAEGEFVLGPWAPS